MNSGSDSVDYTKDNTLEMNSMNGHHNTATCPFLGASVEKNYTKSVKPNLHIKVPQPIRLKNYVLADETCDTLHSRIGEVTSFKTKCTEQVCQLSVMETPGRGEVPRASEELLQEAQAFLTQYYASIRRENSEAHIKRWNEVQKDIKLKGTYQLHTSELVFGAKSAWRNATRCIGRIQWKKLQLFDCREVTTARGMFEALCNHIKYGTNKGNIRSAITVFPQRTDGKHDYRIWNPQLIGYAGYLQPDGTVLGDPMKVEFTEVCLKLGWKTERTAWDILPLVLSADGKDPEFFELPPEIVMEVMLEHPQYKWFKDLGIRWYALPAVSSMKLDCGGLEFTGTAFNGWYMGTEIGCRNLCDSARFNNTEKVAKMMGLDTNSYETLWKDKALVEVNVAVLYSFRRDNVSIVDHHSASDQFMKHFENENKSRGGCPSDWIWIVPPMSASLTPVFHQEMAVYYIRPSYDYQDPPWKTHEWTKADGTRVVHRKFHFKQIARAVKFTSKLFGQALSKRIKATILYATETGKSEQYAKELGTVFGHAFNAQVHCMSDYDVFSIEHETLLLIVASTFGNGEPPANGVEFAELLVQMLYNDANNKDDQSGGFSSVKTPTPKSLMRSNSMMLPNSQYKRQLSRLESNKSTKSSKISESNTYPPSNRSLIDEDRTYDGTAAVGYVTGASSLENLGPLSNIRFAVFGLGSSAYPKFCHFGKTVDKLLGDLGGERILEVGCGDELYGQEQQFRAWSSNIFQIACETFCLDENDMVKDGKNALGTVSLTEETVRFGKPLSKLTVKEALEHSLKKSLITCKVQESKYLGDHGERETVFVDMKPDTDVRYEPGDHVGVMACNLTETVNAILQRLKGVNDFDKVVQLQVMKEILTPTGVVKTWETHERLPAVTVRTLFTRFLDINTPPSTTLLKYLASCCGDKDEANALMELATDTMKYDEWRYFYYPHLDEVLSQFPSCRPQASLLAALLPPLQPRFYSISSSPLAHPQKIHVTIGVVTYKTQNGMGPNHYGVCSTYLKNLKKNDEVIIFTRSAPSFHMPKDISAPLILVGPGTGIAPFRGFWHHRRHQLQSLEPNKKKAGPIWVFFGCRNRELELYKDEKNAALADGVLNKALLALSREKDVHKKYVQALIKEEGADLTRMLVDENGHFYVCGDCKMAEEVQQTLKSVVKSHAKMSDEEADEFILTLMDENRYHEDIFGITLRTAKVQSASRETAKRTRLASIKSLS